MLNSQIEDWKNGFSVYVYDNGGGYLVREVTETKIDALIAARNAFDALIAEERRAILDAAMR